MPNIILTGFSYAGKSAMGRTIARRLGWPAIDTDEIIVRKAGRPVSQIFANDGEERFRELERDALQEACSASRAVISTGGGAVLDPANRSLMAESGVVICLDARAETIYERLNESERRGRHKQPRPLLSGDDPLVTIRQLKASRQPFYAEAHWTVHTDRLSSEQVADEVLHAHFVITGQRLPPKLFKEADFVVTTETQSYPGYIGWNILDRAGHHFREAGLAGNLYIIADKGVYEAHGLRLEQSLAGAGYSTAVYPVPSGEASKTLDAAGGIYEWLAGRRAERGDTVVSFGGGMVGDLGGFVAATYLRGLRLAHVPTSLLAMVDASIGGKVAVNLPAGKNLVGAFYQPSLVLADAGTLTTLPQRELTAGWAEVIKHALILDAGLMAFLQENREPLLSLDASVTSEAIRRSAAIKAGVVSEDEKETTGRRMLLNYGHTIGHALEAAASYSDLLHGEAVAIGMAGAANISHRVGLLDGASVKEQNETLQAFGLPSLAPPVSGDAVRRAMRLDKKVSGKALRWVLLERIGHSTVRGNVPAHVVEETLERVLTSN